MKTRVAQKVKIKKIKKRIKGFLIKRILPFLIFISLLIWFWNSQYLKFQNFEIKIQNQKFLNQKEITNFLNQIYQPKYFLSKNLILPTENQLKKIFKENYSEIAKIEVEKKYGQRKLLIFITEKEPKYLFEQNQNFYWIDKNGMIFSKTKKIPQNKIIFKSIQKLNIGNQYFNSNDKEKIFKLIEIFQKRWKIKIISVTKDKNYFWILKSDKEQKFYLNYNFDLKSIDQKIQNLLKYKKNSKYLNQIKYIHLELNQKIIFCEKGKECDEKIKE